MKKKNKVKINKNPIEFLESLGVPIKNEHFVVIHNKEENCYDLVLQQEGYAVDDRFLDFMWLIHAIGKHCGKYNLRIGARIKEKKKIDLVVPEKPKLILN